MADCKDILKLIYESEGLHLDEKTMGHINTCAECKSHFDTLNNLDHDIDQLKVIKPPMLLVDTTIQRIIQQPSNNQPLLNTRWASGFATVFVLLASMSLLQHAAVPFSPFSISSKERSSPYFYKSSDQTATSAGGGVTSSIGLFDDEPVVVQEKNEVIDSAGRVSAAPKPVVQLDHIAEVETKFFLPRMASSPLFEQEMEGAKLDSPVMAPEQQNAKLNKKYKRKLKIEKKRVPARRKNSREKSSSDPARASFVDKAVGQLGKGSRDNKNLPAGSINLGVRESKDRQEEARSSLPAYTHPSETKEKIARIETFSDQRRSRRQPIKVIAQSEPGKRQHASGNYRRDRLLGTEADVDLDGFGKSDLNISGILQKAISTSSSHPSLHPSLQYRQLARQYLADIQSLDGITFQQATGYWANTYVPGDPEIRLLENRLKHWDRSKITPIIGTNTLIEQSTEQNSQPFDSPSNAALAVYLHADRRAIQNSSRLRVQIGLQASKRFSGHRPLMNVGVLLDTRNIMDKKRIDKLKALLNALAKSKQPGDRFSLTVSGNNGGTWIKPEDFRHGSIQIALRSLNQAKNPANKNRLELLDALSLVGKQVQQDDDQTASLGSSLILFITAASLDNDINRLEEIAHVNAIKGITMSVVPLGKSVAAVHIDRLVLSGQGHRRFLQSPSAAGRLIENELLASSRAIARAVRLRIRLSKGVKLIQVLDSYRLDEAKAQRVREAEQSIDIRLSRNLGIKADRGEDEEGIQIIIPSFYAGDTHVVLLDVVAESSGSIADVTVRYKDLLYLKNGVARSHLYLPGGQNIVGPLERNVVKNMLALKLSQATHLASDRLSVRDVDAAITQIQTIRDLYQGMRQEMAAWNRDSELLHDEQLLNQYIALLKSPVVNDGLEHLADSLRYYGLKKLLAKVD